MFVFGDGNKASNKANESPDEEMLASDEQVENDVTDHDDKADTDSQTDQDSDNDSTASTNDSQDNETNEDQANSTVDNSTIEGIAVTSDDPNVVVATEADWQPIQTNQVEPNLINFNKDSDNWAEMVTAIESVVEIDDMLIHWLGNNGEQQAVGTVSTRDHTEIYRVFIAWVANEGWQPTRVEQLKQLEIIR